MSDDEFDALKASLKAQGSIVACSTEPRCFLDTGICSVAFCAETNRWVRVPCELYDVEMARGETERCSAGPRAGTALAGLAGRPSRLPWPDRRNGKGAERRIGTVCGELERGVSNSSEMCRIEAGRVELERCVSNWSGLCRIGLGCVELE